MSCRIRRPSTRHDLHQPQRKIYGTRPSTPRCDARLSVLKTHRQRPAGGRPHATCSTCVGGGGANRASRTGRTQRTYRGPASRTSRQSCHPIRRRQSLDMRHSSLVRGCRASGSRGRCPSSARAPRQSPTARPTTDPRQAPCWASAWLRDARTQRLASSHRALAAGSSGGPREPHLKVQDAVHTITPGMRAPRRCHGRPPS